MVQMEQGCCPSPTQTTPYKYFLKTFLKQIEFPKFVEQKLFTLVRRTPFVSFVPTNMNHPIHFDIHIVCKNISFLEISFFFRNKIKSIAENVDCRSLLKLICVNQVLF